MRSVRDAGHEVGIHTWDHVRWQDGVADANDAWTEREMRRACERFGEVFGEPAKTHGAAGWQMNDHALRLTEKLGFDYCSDGRGTAPFIPVVGNDIVRCPQLPTTLPTLDELIGVNGIDASNVAAHMLSLTERSAEFPRVYTLHAELEGGQLQRVFAKLLSGWRAQGHTSCRLRDVFLSLDVQRLPRHRVTMDAVPGRSGTLLTQGPLQST
jgi:peptidoglycan/xylan/chitin deacetylase (PgdA/CDA1 family)